MVFLDGRLRNSWIGYEQGFCDRLGLLRPYKPPQSARNGPYIVLTALPCTHIGQIENGCMGP